MFGLDMLWISIDSGHRESRGIVLGEDGYKEKKELLNSFHTARFKYNRKARFGIAFVVMKSNIEELPYVTDLSMATRASEIKVTNIIPYTKEMQEEMLCDISLSSGAFRENKLKDKRSILNLPLMDFENVPPNVMAVLMKSGQNFKLGENRIVRKSEHCKFIEDDSLFVRWDGEVSPRIALLHNNKTYLHNVERKIRHCSYGNIKKDDLKSIWDSKEYKNFRNRVRNFEFSPCINCGLCELAENNEEDCLGNPFSVCGQRDLLNVHNGISDCFLDFTAVT